MVILPQPHALRGGYCLHKSSTKQAIGEIVKKFGETAVITNIERPAHHCFARCAQNIAFVSKSVAEDPNVRFLVVLRN